MPSHDRDGIVPDLGDLNRVNIRDVWPHEAHDFTPWLAANIEALGAVLGLELQLEQTEAEVGDYSLDLLARDLGTDQLVVIENQFGSTDHDHLGKLLTYAAGFDAKAVVWICESIREEHRQALDWLNQRTDTDTNFFGVVIEVLQIDDSRPAFSFKPVVFPNEWQRVQKTRTRQGTSSRSEAYRSYFQKLVDVLREEHRFTNAKIGQPTSWYFFSSGVSGVHYAASFAQGGRARCEFYIGTPDAAWNAALFDSLSEKHDKLEKEIGAEFEWEPLEGKLACRIALYRDGSITDGPDVLQEVHEWHVKWLLKLRSVLGPELSSVQARPIGQT